MRRIALAAMGLALTLAVVAGVLRRPGSHLSPLQQVRERFERKPVASVDHTKLQALQREFGKPQDVTRACLSCHTERHREVMASSHWNWEREEFIPGRGIRRIGKKNILNNYCIGVASNLESCDKCHAGYGFVGPGFDFSEPGNIDCLACHDRSGTYERAGNGMPAPSVDLTHVAQRVGRPQRANCGACHFLGGGGNNVKHGDLEMALLDASRDVDVHMTPGGADLQCVDCHEAPNHRMLGKVYSVSSMNRNRSTCEQCHGAYPHGGGILDEHTLKVACQTCHIPTYAKGAATKLSWDWSTAGRLRDGRPYEEKDADGNVTYASIKGTFTWGKNIRPEYVWFNGTAGHYLLGDAAPGTGVLQINSLNGDYADPDAKIVPVKVHRGRQIYDPGTGMLVQPKLYAPEAGVGAFWKDFDWDTASREGMKAVGLPYSGRHAFIETAMYWPVNHMVAPKEQAVACVECHTRSGSRLEGLRDFYLPGRDREPLVERLGIASILGALVGVVLHGSARIVAARRREAGAR